MGPTTYMALYAGERVHLVFSGEEIKHSEDAKFSVKVSEVFYILGSMRDPVPERCKKPEQDSPKRQGFSA